MPSLDRISGLVVTAEPGGEIPYVGGARCRHAHAADKRLCIKTVLRGTERLQRPHRTIRLDEDSYVVENGWDVTARRGRAEGRTVALVFTSSQIDRALNGAALPVFHEHLRLKAGDVGTRLRAIEDAVQTGNLSPAALDEQVVLMLRSLLHAEQELDAYAQRIQCVKSATRQELLRRLLLATDFIQSHYELPVQLDDIAQAASLSRFHLVRLFRQVLGVTPHAYLLNKRLSVAGRLLINCDSNLNQIAIHSGFGNRWSLFRSLQAQHGAGGQALRDAYSAAQTSIARASA